MLKQENRDWIDRFSREAINSKLFELYMESKNAYLEVSFPEFGNTVLYGDTLNHSLKSSYLFP